MQLIDVKAKDYVVPGAPPKLIPAREKNKAGTVIGTYAITVWLPTGSAGAQGGYTLEVAIPESHFEFLKASGIYSVIDYQEPINLTVHDFVPEYVPLIRRVQSGDFTAFGAYIDLVTRITAAGFTVAQVAAAAGVTAGK